MVKKDKLKTKINEFINIVIDKADKEDKLNYFNIEITNHDGNLQLDYSMRDRKKVY